MEMGQCGSRSQQDLETVAVQELATLSIPKSWHMAIPFTLPRREGVQVPGGPCTRLSSGLGGIGSHEGIASHPPARKSILNGLNDLRERRLQQSASLAIARSRLFRIADLLCLIRVATIHLAKGSTVGRAFLE
jgi:hypothetical protein